MSPIIVTKCKCSKNNIYINIPKEKYFREESIQMDGSLNTQNVLKKKRINIIKKILKKMEINGQ